MYLAKTTVSDFPGRETDRSDLSNSPSQLNYPYDQVRVYVMIHSFFFYQICEESKDFECFGFFRIFECRVVVFNVEKKPKNLKK